MAERWITKIELCKHLCISVRTLERAVYPVVTEGVHFRKKDPFNPMSHKVWKLSKVELLLTQSTAVLRRRRARKLAAAK